MGYVLLIQYLNQILFEVTLKVLQTLTAKMDEGESLAHREQLLNHPEYLHSPVILKK